MSNLLTTKNAAKLLGLNYKTFHIWNKEGILKPIILENGGWRYDKDSLCEFYSQYCESKKNRKHTIDDARVIAKNHDGECLSLAYVDNKEKLSFKCKEGHVFCASFNSVSSKNTWCDECDNTNKSKYTIRDCIEYAKSNGGICLSTKYGGKLNWQCGCGYVWSSYFANMIRTNSWCQKCTGTVRHTIEDCHILAKKMGGSCLSDKYVDCKDKLKWKCNIGHTWEVSFSVVNDGSWCKQCADNRLKNTIDDCNIIAATKGGECLSTVYKNALSLLSWKCKSGHTWNARYNCIKTGRWCPHCSNHISKPQREIFLALQLRFPNIQVILNDTKIIRPHDIDIFIPSLNIGIEYDGEHWHYSDWAISHGSLENMAIKNQKCEALDIKLLRIRERDYLPCKESILENTYKFIITNNKGI